MVRLRLPSTVRHPPHGLLGRALINSCFSLSVGHCLEPHFGSISSTCHLQNLLIPMVHLQVKALLHPSPWRALLAGAISQPSCSHGAPSITLKTWWQCDTVGHWDCASSDETMGPPLRVVLESCWETPMFMMTGWSAGYSIKLCLPASKSAACQT